ncbi:MAG TPA: glycosyltransferase, partial [Vicinamibacteria bacterium]
ENVLAGSPASLRLVLAGGLEEGGANRRYVESVRERIRRSPVRESIDEVGYVPAEKLDGVFAAADVFVQPSVRPAGLSASSVLFRAMAAGLAIVASDVGTFPEEVRHLETGLLVPPGDAGALAAALVRLGTDPELRERLGRGARTHVETEHDGARVARAAADVYEEVARP